MRAPKFTPMIITGSTIILPNNAGSFNVCGCPDPEELGMFIHDACNRDHLFDELVKALKECRKAILGGTIINDHRGVVYQQQFGKAFLDHIESTLTTAGVK